MIPKDARHVIWSPNVINIMVHKKFKFKQFQTYRIVGFGFSDGVCDVDRFGVLIGSFLARRGTGFVWVTARVSSGSDVR